MRGENTKSAGIQSLQAYKEAGACWCLSVQGKLLTLTMPPENLHAPNWDVPCPQSARGS